MNAQRPTILIVDDEEEIVNLLKDHFSTRNCEAIAAADPLTVVEKLRAFSVQLMLLDLKMTKSDGFEVLEKINQAGLKLPPILIMTGYLAKYQARLESHGISLDDVITKPFRFEVLEESINRKLGGPVVGSEEEGDSETKQYSKNRCRLGIVEDESDVLSVFRDFFTERNYKVSCFTNGKAALNALETEPVDILLVDMKLPGIQGDQVIEELSKSAHPPLMIPMSGDYFREPLKKRLEGLGCVHFIEKPVNVIQMFDLIRTLAIERGLLG